MRSGARAYRPRSTDSVNSSAPDSVRAGSPAPRPPASLLRSRFRLRTSDGLDHRISETTKCSDLRIRGPCSAPRKRCYIKDFGGDEVLSRPRGVWLCEKTPSGIRQSAHQGPSKLSAGI